MKELFELTRSLNNWKYDSRNEVMLENEVSNRILKKTCNGFKY